MNDPYAIRCIELCKSYGSRSAPVHALRGISFEARRGERIALLGKSGSGKSTLLNLLGGIDTPTTGSLLVDGHDLERISGRDLARFRSTKVGMIFQSFNLIPTRTAVQNVELPMIFRGISSRVRRAEARQALENVGLGARIHHRPAQLSGGEAQRVAVARSMINRPAILLADEPTGNLDSATANDIMTLITNQVREHTMTLVLVTHDEELARTYTDRIVRLKDGSIV